MSVDHLIFNGIDGASGESPLPPLTPRQIAAIAQGQQLDEQQLAELRWWHRRVTQEHRGPIEGVDPKNLAEASWGVIFAHDADPAIREALGELLEHRRSQATAQHEHYYQEYSGVRGYRPAGGQAAVSGSPMALAQARPTQKTSPTTCCSLATPRRSHLPSSISLMCSMRWDGFILMHLRTMRSMREVSSRPSAAAWRCRAGRSSLARSTPATQRPHLARMN